MPRDSIAKEKISVTSTTSTNEFNPGLWVWGANASKPRVLHSMVRVMDVDVAIRFYVNGLGMKVLGRFDVETRRSTGVYLGFGDYDAGGVLELAHKWDHKGPYTHGSGYGHISIGVPDLTTVVAKLESMGAEIATPPKILIPGGPAVAFVKDPDGYEIELVQTRRS
jgi:lactoylglutathione lyase